MRTQPNTPSIRPFQSSLDRFSTKRPQPTTQPKPQRISVVRIPSTNEDMKTTAQRQLPMFPFLGHTDSVAAGESDRRHKPSHSSRSIPFPPARRSQPIREVSPPYRSPSIPISDMSTSPPEVDRRYEEAMADQLDYMMFTRILGRMAQQNQEKNRFMIQQENSPIMMSIINTRNGHNDIPSVVEDSDHRPTFRRSPAISNLGDWVEIEDETTHDDDGDVVFQLDL